MNSLIKLARPKHYIKNLLLFAPLCLSLQYSEKAFLNLVLGFFAYSFTASFGYIINDILDVQSDRQHHIKKYRPIAAGDVSIVNAFILSFFLLSIGLLLGFYINYRFGLLLVIYFILNSLYSTLFKTFKWIDVTLLSSFFIIRLYAGSIASNSLISNWFILTSIFLFLMMSIDKRYNELFHSENSRRAYRGSDQQLLLSYRSAFLVAILICINLYMNDLVASGFIRVLVTFLSFVLLTSLLEKNEEDQVSKILNFKFVAIMLILALLYVLIKLNIL
jgi:4-hydroxybenzoate polyprenyltransferase